MKAVRTSNIQLYKIIVRCEQRDGPPRPSAHHVTGRLKNNKNRLTKEGEYLGVPIGPRARGDISSKAGHYFLQTPAHN